MDKLEESRSGLKLNGNGHVNDGYIPTDSRENLLTADSPKPDKAQPPEEDKSKKNGDTTKLPPVSLKTLFRFATWVDVILMVVGGLFACVTGLGWPAMNIVFGKMTDLFTEGMNTTTFVAPTSAQMEHMESIFDGIRNMVTMFLGEQNITFIPLLPTIAERQATMEAKINEFILYYVYIGAATLVASSIQVCCWVTSCERQIHKMRKAFLKSILHQEMAWFDSHESGSLTSRLSEQRIPEAELWNFAAEFFNDREEHCNSMTRVQFSIRDMEHVNGEGSGHASGKHRGSDYSDEGGDIANLHDFNKHKMRRRQSVSAESFDPSEPDAHEEIEIVYHKKTDDQLERLKKAVAGVFLFRSLDSVQLLKILNALFEVEATPGMHVIEQGDENADNFYVVESGIYDVFVKNALGEPQHCWEYNNSGSFGELALMYNQPRAATIVCRTAGKLWALDRQTFQRIVLKAAFKKRCKYMELIDNVDFLAELVPYEKQNLCDALQPKTFQNGDVIVRQGDFADGMYFLESGEVIVTRSEEGVEKELDRLVEGAYFGELALITQRPRAATIVANGECRAAFLDVKAFERLLGPCVEIMKRNIDRYRHQLEKVFGQSHLLESTEL